MLVGCNQISALNGINRNTAQRQAEAWVAEIYRGRQATVVCQNSDSDHNGYITCSVRVENDPVMSIECSAPYTFNDGCKLPTFQNMIQRTR